MGVKHEKFKKSWRGVGGRAQRLPPMAFGGARHEENAKCFLICNSAEKSKPIREWSEYHVFTLPYSNLSSFHLPSFPPSIFHLSLLAPPSPFIPSLLHCLLPCFPSCRPSSFLPCFPSFLPSLPFSFLPSFLPSFLACLLPSFLPSFLPSSLPSFLPSLLPPGTGKKFLKTTPELEKKSLKKQKKILKKYYLQKQMFLEDLPRLALCKVCLQCSK